MGLSLRRKLYTRGSSFETTVPAPLLFSLDSSKKHDVVFQYDAKNARWYVEIIPAAAESYSKSNTKKAKKNLPRKKQSSKRGSR